MRFYCKPWMRTLQTPKLQPRSPALLGTTTKVLTKHRILMAVSRTRYNAVDGKVACLSNGWVPILGANPLHRSHHQLLHSSCVGSKHLDNDDEKIINHRHHFGCLHDLHDCCHVNNLPLFPAIVVGGHCNGCIGQPCLLGQHHLEEAKVWMI